MTQNSQNHVILNDLKTVNISQKKKKKTFTKKRGRAAGRMAQGVSSEFKPQYCKNK
jgi:hypothetical protein